MSGMNATLVPFSTAAAASPRVFIRGPAPTKGPIFPPMPSMISGVFVSKHSEKYGTSHHLILSEKDANTQVIRTAAHFLDAPAVADPTTPFAVDNEGVYTVKINTKDFGTPGAPLPEEGQAIRTTVEYNWYSMLTEKGVRCGSYAKLICWE